MTSEQKKIKSSITLRREPPAIGRLRDTLLNPLVCSIGAVIGIFGGISALIVGLFCVVVHVALINDNAFNRVGTVLLMISIPMLLVGSALMDEIDKRR